MANKEISDKRLKLLTKRSSATSASASTGRISIPVDREIRETTRAIQSIASKLESLQKVYISFIVDPKIDLKHVNDKIANIAEPCERYDISFSDNTTVIIRDISIDLTSSSH